MKFSKLGLNENLVIALSKQGITSATDVQQQTLPHVFEGRDVIVRSQTGSGKTLAYLLPLLQNVNFNENFVQALVVCPTRELALQVKEEVDKIIKSGTAYKVVPIYGGSDITRQINALKKKPHIVVGTPGRIIDHINRRTLKLHQVKSVVLDEADEMLSMGFKDDIETILKQTPAQKQTLLFSATFPKEILQIINQYQNNAVKIEVGEDRSSLDNIRQYYTFVNKTTKMQDMLDLYNKLKPTRSIIFTNTKIMAQNLSDFFNRNGNLSQSLHGDLRQSTRKKVINEIKNNKVNILVASDVAARGIDISGVDYVFNYDLPYNVEYYLHRIGRTARAGNAGNSVSIITTKGQFATLKEYEKITNSLMKEIKLTNENFNYDTKKRKNSKTKTTAKTNLSDNRARVFDNKSVRGDKTRSFAGKPKRGEERSFSGKPKRGEERSFSGKRTREDGRDRSQTRTFSTDGENFKSARKRKSGISEESFKPVKKTKPAFQKFVNKNSKSRKK